MHKNIFFFFNFFFVFLESSTQIGYFNTGFYIFNYIKIYSDTNKKRRNKKGRKNT